MFYGWFNIFVVKLSITLLAVPKARTIYGGEVNATRTGLGLKGKIDCRISFSELCRNIQKQYSGGEGGGGVAELNFIFGKELR